MRSESGRWYQPDTKQCVLEITGKNGKPRKPNIADAVKLGLLPSVTTVMQVKAKPGLVRWQISNAIHAALTLPKIAGETDDVWLDRIMDDAEEQAKTAAETGKDFHSAFEAYWKNGTIVTGDTATDNAVAHIAVWRKKTENLFPGVVWHAEVPYLSDFGICGTPDLVGISPNAIIVGDYKTCDLAKHKEPYSEHAMQIATGIDAMCKLHKCNPRDAFGVEFYVDRTSGEMKIHDWYPGDIKRGLAMMDACVRLWMLENRWQDRLEENSKK